ncbi:hypothetical protein R3P38DRAFT_3109077 [Favolaschia claudopus]|uniref:F-box domain-containing protein n=1 Tax=Favolaschia claudopus TaxID=2862362 RepID=A0AAV9ZI85_9AGAR
MHNLPPELTALIFSFLEVEGLWNVVGVSRPFRDLAIFQLLGRYGYTKEHIYSGEIRVAEEAFCVLPAISRIHPITTVTASLQSTTPPNELWRRLQRLADAIEELTDVSYVVISGIRAGNDAGIARVAAKLSRTMDPLVIAGFCYPGIRVSRFLNTAPVWNPKFRVRDLLENELEHGTGYMSLLCCSPLLAVISVVGYLRNLYYWAISLHRRRTGPAWNQTLRIANDLPEDNGHTVHIQNFPSLGPSGERYTLVTFKGSGISYWGGLAQFNIPRRCGLSTAQLTHVLDRLDLGPELTNLTVREHCSIGFSALHDFMAKHERLVYLSLGRKSIEMHSFLMPNSPANPGRLRELSTPAEYIPHFVLNQPHMVQLTISCHARTTNHHLSTAIRLIAASYLHKPLTKLTLWLDFSRRNEPVLWRSTTAVGSEELPSGPMYGSVDKRGFPQWLARCSALRTVTIGGDWVDQSQRKKMVEAIHRAREAVGLSRLDSVQFVD